MEHNFKINKDRLYFRVINISPYFLIFLLASIYITLFIFSYPAIKQFGLSFITSSKWDPVFNKFGSLAFIYSTIVTSILSLIISLPFSISLAIYLGFYKKEGKIAEFLKTVIELLAGMPSVIYGFWGLFVFVPLMRNLEIKLGVLPYGVGIVSASIILAIMIIPYTTIISREVISLVPNDLIEASYSLGATKYETIKNVVFPYSLSGIFAGVLLSFGRAIGETMAVTMLIGNANSIPQSLFGPGNTMASVIANEFTEATGDIHLSSLFLIGLLLLIITSIFNLLGRVVINKFKIEG